jgi:hypothetical protein
MAETTDVIHVTQADGTEIGTLSPTNIDGLNATFTGTVSGDAVIAVSDVLTLSLLLLSYFDGVIVFPAIVAVSIHTIMTIVSVFSIFPVVAITSVFSVTTIAVIVAILLFRHIHSVKYHTGIGKLLFLDQRVEQCEVSLWRIVSTADETADIRIAGYLQGVGDQSYGSSVDILC